MTHNYPAGQGPVRASGRRGRFLSGVLSGLLMASLLVVPADGVSAASLNPAPAARDGLSAGTTLAVVRATGASLYDDAGQPVRDLPSGAAFKVSGRTADMLWFYGATRDGAVGWVSATNVLVFGISNVPVREGFTAPTSLATEGTETFSEGAPETATEPAAATQGAASATSESSVASRLPAIVKTGSQRLNVRSGPGTNYPVIGGVANATALTASARNAAADWIRVEGASLPAGSAWVSASYLTLQGRALDLPVAAPAAVAVAQPASAQATASSAAVGLTGKLVFQSSSGGALYSYNLATGALRSLTTGADPDVSPDGRTVAFWRESGGSHGLYLIDSDGSNERLILTRNEALRAPTWSPDSSKIVFSHVNGKQKCRDVGYNMCMPDAFPYNLMFPLKVTDAWGLARVDRGGGDYQDLAAIPNAIAPDWAAGGIFYAGTGIQVTQDVSDDSASRAILNEYRYQDPAEQPGGNRIVFHTLEKDHWEIFAAQADGSGVTALTRPETTLVDVLPHNVAPAWSPDGRHIVFLSNRTGRWQLWVMDADGGNPRALPVDVPITYNYQAEQVVSWAK